MDKCKCINGQALFLFTARVTYQKIINKNTINWFNQFTQSFANSGSDNR
ncbi:hypothetical protein QWZ16_17620 [Vibrio ostreicida]|uniref:Uncharacterized protein n=1 Tax=Vibrio ostreicida TaxID=526588 RepID=A0ABT8BYF1_9VIBR|nr:hypothetical protein [Vibrio ostreicida]MDN3611421.1 hypothetical protein [Vibrio ostreicida]